MANINLFKSVKENEDVAKSLKKAKRGFILPLIFLLIVVLLWGGLKAYSIFLEKKETGIDENISAESNNLEGKDINRVVDFQGRLDKISQANKGKSDPNNLFTQFQNSVVQGSSVSDFKYSNDAVDVTFSCDDFSVVAKEILSFKKSDFFSGVMINSITRDTQTGKVILELNLSVKN